MKKITLLIFMGFCAIGFSQNKATNEPLGSNSQTVQLPAAYYNSTGTAVGETTGLVSTNEGNDNLHVPFTGTYYFQSPDAIVYDNGPYFNVAGPPDISFLQDATLGMSLYGFGAQFTGGNSMADDVTLSDEYNITSIDVFAYQTGSSAPSITALYLQVWDGDPSGGGASVIWGDLTTDILDTATATDAFRQLESAPGDTSREIQRATALTTGLSLTAGTYWIEYSFEGSGASGPWAPPIVITGTAATGNALQNQAGLWIPAEDTASFAPQGMPFVMYGDLVGGGGTACNESNPSNGFENGYTSSSDTAQIIATDLTVAINDNMSFNKATTNFIMPDGDTVISADIIVYADDFGGLPDPSNIIASQTGIVPSSQTLLGDFPAASQLDVTEVVFDLTPIALAGQAAFPTTYWVSVYVTTSAGSGGPGYWETTTASIVGYPSAFSPDGGVTWLIATGTDDLVYNFEGECDVLGVSENALEGFAYYPNPTNGALTLKSVKNIDTVAIYNLLGQSLLNSEIGATTSNLDISGLTTGTYIMKVTVEGQTGTYKVLKN